MSEMFAEVLPLTKINSWIDTKRRGRGVQKIEHIRKIFSNSILEVTDYGEGCNISASIKDEYIEKVERAFNRKYPQYREYLDERCFYSVRCRIADITNNSSSTYNPRHLVIEWVKAMTDTFKTTKDGVEAVRLSVEKEIQREHDRKIREMVNELKALPAEDLKEVLSRLGLAA